MRMEVVRTSTAEKVIGDELVEGDGEGDDAEEGRGRRAPGFGAEVHAGRDAGVSVERRVGRGGRGQGGRGTWGAARSYGRMMDRCLPHAHAHRRARHSLPSTPSKPAPRASPSQLRQAPSIRSDLPQTLIPRYPALFFALLDARPAPQASCPRWPACHRPASTTQACRTRLQQYARRQHGLVRPPRDLLFRSRHAAQSNPPASARWDHRTPVVIGSALRLRPPPPSIQPPMVAHAPPSIQPAPCSSPSTHSPDPFL